MYSAEPLEIITAATEEQYRQARELIQAFLHWHAQRHQGTTLTRDYYDTDEFKQELASLPAKYGSGRHRLLLAYYNARPVGCVALRELDKKSCEMKRMFVDAQYQGKGIGKALAQALIKDARSMGYSIMKLNTGVRQTEALKLYENLHFRRTAPYYHVPKRAEDWLVFMELKL